MPDAGVDSFLNSFRLMTIKCDEKLRYYLMPHQNPCRILLNLNIRYRYSSSDFVELNLI